MDVLAIINPTQPLSKDDYVQLAKELIIKYNITLINIRYRSYPEGVGELNVENSILNETDVRRIEEALKRNFNKTLGLVDTIIGIRVKGKIANLLKLQQENYKVALVDVNHIEIAYEYLSRINYDKLEIKTGSLGIYIYAYRNRTIVFPIMIKPPTGYLIEHISPRR